MKLRMIPRFKHTYTLGDLLFSIRNSFSKSCNKNLSNYFDTESIYFTNYARTSLRLLLSSISMRKKITVGIQPFTCHTVFMAIKNAGCDFIFIDINESYTIDTDDLQRKIDKIDALIVTHTFGFPANIEKILEIAKGKYILEDCAHAFLSKYKGVPLGKYGDAAFFSIGYGKFPSIGPGGYAIINNDKLKLSFEKLYNSLRQIKKIKEIKNSFKNYIYSLAYNSYIYGLITYPILKKFDSRFDFLNKGDFAESKGYVTNANLLNKNFSKYQTANQEKKTNAINFTKELSNIDPDSSISAEPNYYVFPKLHPQRDYIIDYLIKNGVEAGKHFSESINWAREYGYIDGSCPNAERIAENIYTIPIHSYLKQKDIKEISKLLKSVL